MKPYLKSIYVYNNYANQHFLIDFPPDEEEDFKHLIITGNNGSGKTTLLNSVNKNFIVLSEKIVIPQNYFLKEGYSKKELEVFKNAYRIKVPSVEFKFVKQNEQYQKQNNFFNIYIPTNKYSLNKNNDYPNLKELNIGKNNTIKNLNGNSFKIIRSLINEINKVVKNNKSLQFNIEQLNDRHDIVANIQKEINNNNDFIANNKQGILNSIFNIQNKEQNLLSTFFLPFLLKLKDEQAYAIADEETKKADGLTNRFKNLEDVFQILYEEPKLKLKHQYKNDRKFFFDLPDGRHIDFNQLSHGHNAVLTMISEIMLNIEAYREEFPNDVNPKGIVVIDEIESHLHLSLQEKILPALIKMFPNMQFIVATHSPAVIASINNVTVYDLSSQTTVNENLTGIPYDVIMKNHFGIESEYSISVTKKLNRVKELLSKEKPTKNESEEIEKLAKELNKLSPDLALDIIVELERRERNG